MRKVVGLIIVCITTAIFSAGQTLTILYNFGSQIGFTDGLNPGSILIQASDENIYGTTEYGGNHGYGTVFRISLTGALTTLYSFCSQDNCSNGMLPWGGLVQGTDGNFYGTTVGGGTKNYGTVFKITPQGALSTLHNFDGMDGGEPYAALLQGRDGDFYGMALQGAYGAGTVFKITPEGELTTLHNFNTTDGSYPYAALVQAKDGNFYGTTSVGGASGDGTVFIITPEGMLTTLHNFNRTDGGSPMQRWCKLATETFMARRVSVERMTPVRSSK